MVSKKNVILSILFILFTPAYLLSGNFFKSFTQVGYGIGLQVTIDEDVKIDINYVLNLINDSNYQASVGFNIMRMLHQNKENTSLYITCKHRDGINSLYDMTNMVHATDSSVLSDGGQEGKTVLFDKRSSFNVFDFCLRSFFSLGKKAQFSTNGESFDYAYKSGAELITDVLNNSHDVLHNVSESSLHDVINGKGKKVTYNEDLGKALFTNRALQASIVATVMLSLCKKDLEQEWLKIKQSAAEGFEAGRRRA